MEIVFKRRLTNELMTTYLPSPLLLLMSYATTFFKPFYFEAAVTVNLSILLVTTTLFIRLLRALIWYWDHLKNFIAEIPQGPLGMTIGTIWVTQNRSQGTPARGF